MRSRVVRPLTPPEGEVSRTGDAHGMIKATQRHEIPDGHDSAEASLANNGRCHITSEVTIRAIRVDDRERWEPLWQGYLDFYRAVLTPEVTEGTWVALCDPTSAVYGLVAEQEDQLAGFAHLVLHPTTWATHPTCYLEDLYVAKPWRGGDIARRLIEAVYAFADGFGPASVYWLTQEYNAPARSLYDTLAHRTSFVVYRR
jgi:GNAT superfamily N-acetyltransferase